MRCSFCKYEGESVRSYQYTTYDDQALVTTLNACNRCAGYWGYTSEELVNE